MKETITSLPDTESSVVSIAHKKAQMDDRKRPHNDMCDETHPSKRQAVAPSSSSVPQNQEDVVHFQKEAIFRQMQVYKREKDIAQDRLDDLNKRVEYHDQHLRIVDAWWDQMLDEVRLLVTKDPSEKAQVNGGVEEELSKSLLHFRDVPSFEDHLLKKQEHIISTLGALFKYIKPRSAAAASTPADEKLEKLSVKIAELLANEKVHQTELDRLQSEKEDLEDLLTNAALRYLQAEKRLDRYKSVTLAKIEKQAQASSSNTNSNKSDGKGSSEDKEGDRKSKSNDGNYATVELARREAEAIAAKQEKELQQLQSENARLSEQVTNFTVKFTRLSEEDIMSCDVYKNVKAKLDDLIARYNNIEALNNNLQKEAEMLQAERTKYKENLQSEQELAISDMKNQMMKNDADLARIRAVRDELVQNNQLLKTNQEKHLSTVEAANELAGSRSRRIEVLESEISRLRLQLSQAEEAEGKSLEDMTKEQLVNKLTQLQRSYQILEEELPALGDAYKKANELCNSKYLALQEASVKMDRLVQEKLKADQKYFGAMKAKDAIQSESKLLKIQHSKSSEIIAQLKDAEKSYSSVISNLEKQVAELKNVQNMASNQKSELNRRIVEGTNTVESLKNQAKHLTETLKSKDTEYASEKQQRVKAETEVEKLQAELSTLKSELQASRNRDTGNDAIDALRSLAYCSVCRIRIKNQALKTCGHVFCKDCAEERITSRSRKCPNCGRPFASTDLIHVHL